MLNKIIRNILIVFVMIISSIVVMFFYMPTRELLIRIAVVIGLTNKVCENVETNGEMKYTVVTCREDLNILGKVFSVKESF